MDLNLGKTFEQIASSFLGNSTEMSAAGPEPLQTSGEVIQEHWGEIVFSTDQYIPGVIGNMETQEVGRQKQVTGIVERSDVLGAPLGYEKPLTLDGDPRLLEQVLQGHNPDVLLRDKSTQQIIRENDELHQAVTNDRKQQDINAAREKVAEAADPKTPQAIYHAEDSQFALFA